jgi:hypothetical protein
MDRDLFIKLLGQVTVAKCKLMKFIPPGEAAYKVKDNEEFGKEVIKGWETLSTKFRQAVILCSYR